MNSYLVLLYPHMDTIKLVQVGVNATDSVDAERVALQDYPDGLVLDVEEVNPNEEGV